ncbi:hypothetical protein [Fluviicola taffensis]|uniref:hypothetical protein n=1 Tax=Fluviicola taffensis TaxID=191579 RepID=UPI003137A09B
MIGIWNGAYQHQSKRIPEDRRNQQTRFRIEITLFDGSNFSGTVEDDLKTGGTRGNGIIEGRLKGNQIEFIKKMPVHTSLDRKGNRIEEQKPHRNIYYSGELKNNLVKGTWKFKFGIGKFNDKWALFPAVKGVWEMAKESNQTI